MRCCWRRPRPPSAGASPDQSEILSCASTRAPPPPLQSVTVTVAFTGHVRPWGVSGGSESESSARMPARGVAEAQRLRGTEAQRGAAAWRCSVSVPQGVQLIEVHRGGSGGAALACESDQRRDDTDAARACVVPSHGAAEEGGEQGIPHVRSSREPAWGDIARCTGMALGRLYGAGGKHGSVVQIEGLLKVSPHSVARVRPSFSANACAYQPGVQRPSEPTPVGPPPNHTRQPLSPRG